MASILKPQRRWLALTLAAVALSACSLGPLGQADAPTSAAAPTDAPTGAAAPTAARATAAPRATAAAPTPTVALSTAPASGLPAGAHPLAEISGSFSYTNDILNKYYTEHMAALVDMYGFVKRDKEWELPVDSQVLGFLKLDAKTKTGQYHVQLPEQPTGQFVDVNHDGKQDAGVQVFVTTYWPNLAGGPYSEGDDKSRGWPSYLASTKNDSEHDDEVIGGKLVVWAPDAQQQFPTGFGADGRLFTDDDPVGALPAGYAVVDLDQQPFAISQAAQQDVPLYEPSDIALKDYSKLSYTDAFKQMVEKLRKEYAFNGIDGKTPDWEAIDRDIAPRVAEAERSQDADAFAAAIYDFTLQFHDGHVGGSIPNIAQLFSKAAGGGYGFTGRELDDGRYIVTFVLKNGPAAQAGMLVGAEVTAFGDKPIKDAISAVKPFEGPFSTDFALRTAQQRYLVRAPLGTTTNITFANPGAAATTARLTAVREVESYFQSLPPSSEDPTTLPVEARTLDTGAGYIKLNSNEDDLNLTLRLFERALKAFEDNKAPALILDLRHNYGGAPLSLAGFFTKTEIPLGQTEYYNDNTGAFEADGLREKVTPYEEQYHFDKLVMLVDQTCYSACEIEAYGFSQLPGVTIVGQYPTAGVEAEVARGMFKLPDDISLQFPTGRLTLPDGSLFLEGKGVQPTVRVPINEQNVLSQDDVVLKAAEQAVGR